MTSQPGSSHLPTGHQRRRKAGAIALTRRPVPLIDPAGSGRMGESDSTPQVTASSLQHSRYSPKTGKVLGISPTRPLETHIIFYAGKEACA